MKAPRKRRWTRMLAVMACFAVIALLVWQLPVFRLSGIDATDMRSVSKEDLIKASGLTDGQHLFAGLGGTLTQIIQLR